MLLARSMVGVGLNEEFGRYGSVSGEVSPEQLRGALDALLADLNPAKSRQGDVLTCSFHPPNKRLGNP